MKKVKIQRLTEKGFQEYGTVLSVDAFTSQKTEGVCDWFGHISCMENVQDLEINMMTVYPRKITCRQFERHLTAQELIVPLGGRGLIIPMAKPGELLEENLTAFYIPGNWAVIFNPGTWHFTPHTLEESATFLAMFRRGTGLQDTYFDALDAEYEMEL